MNMVITLGMLMLAYVLLLLYIFMRRTVYLLMPIILAMAILLLVAEKQVLINQFAIASAIGVMLSCVFLFFQNRYLKKTEEERQRVRKEKFAAVDAVIRQQAAARWEEANEG